MLNPALGPLLLDLLDLLGLLFKPTPFHKVRLSPFGRARLRAQSCATSTGPARVPQATRDEKIILIFQIMNRHRCPSVRKALPRLRRRAARHHGQLPLNGSFFLLVATVAS